MKNTFNFLIFAAAGILLVSGCGSGNFKVANTGMSSNSVFPSSINQNASGPAKDLPGLTPENFNKIERGMTYEEVVKLLGSEGIVVRRGDYRSYQLATYGWKFNKTGYIGCQFRDGKLDNKSHYGFRVETNLR